MLKENKTKTTTSDATRGRVLAEKYSFSKANLLVFAAVFALIGGWFLWKSLAAGIGSSLPPRLPESTGSVFYVSSTGSDSNPGSLSAPWRTIQKATTTLTSGQKAQVRDGTYAESINIYGRSGTASDPITIEAYPGETPAWKPVTNDRQLEISSNVQYWRIRALIFEGSYPESGGQIDVYGGNVEIVANIIRNRKGKGVYTD